MDSVLNSPMIAYSTWLKLPLPLDVCSLSRANAVNITGHSLHPALALHLCGLRTLPQRLLSVSLAHCPFRLLLLLLLSAMTDQLLLLLLLFAAPKSVLAFANAHTSVASVCRPSPRLLDVPHMCSSFMLTNSLALPQTPTRLLRTRGLLQVSLPQTFLSADLSLGYRTLKLRLFPLALALPPQTTF
jgi:hypothetical protein